MILDFTTNEFQFPKAEFAWQKEIIDFINYYKSNDKIEVKTSGSTGEPKRIFLDKKDMQLSAKLTAKYLNSPQKTTALLCLPVSYIAGKMMIVRAMEIGWKLHCIEPKSKIVFHEKVDFSAFTPMQAEQSFIKNNNTLKIGKIILGGAKVSHDLERFLSNFSTQFYETYAMTETITHIALRKLNNQKAFHVFEEVKISKDDRNCLVIETPFSHKKVITNDVVDVLSESRFIWKGRIDNIINSGGLKINPEEIENILKPFIEKPFVIHYKKDKILGQKLVLIIEDKEEKNIKIPQNILPKNKMPKEIVYISSFPRTQSGKIQRNRIINLL